MPKVTEKPYEQITFEGNLCQSLHMAGFPFLWVICEGAYEANNHARVDQAEFNALFSIVYTSLVVGILFAAMRICKRITEFYYIRKNLRKEWKGPNCHWFWGHLGMVTKGNKDPARFITYFTEKEKEFPFGFTIYPGPFRAVLRLHHPNIVKQVLSATALESPKTSGTYAALVPWLGRGLLVLDGHEWFRHRRLLTSAFHFEILKPYAKAMNNSAQTLVMKWSSMMKNSNSVRVEIFSESSLMTLDTILQCLLSYKSNCQVEKIENGYVSSIYNLSKLIVDRGRSKNLFMRFDSFYSRTNEGKQFQSECEAVHKFSDSFIQQRRHQRNANDFKKESSYLDFLDVLLLAQDSDGNSLTDAEIRAEMDTFLFEGHDTTASAISWFLYALACHPSHQEKCAAEIQSVMQDRMDVSWTDLSSFPYLTRCIKESLRMYPPVPVVVRKLNRDIYAEGKTILKGTVVQLSIMGVQRSELFWKDPQTFNPDRFTTESSSLQHHYAFIPFSAGPRNCIGQNFALNEIKIAIAQALKRFKFSVDPKHNIIHCHEIIYRARGGLYLLIESRS